MSTGNTIANAPKFHWIAAEGLKPWPDLNPRKHFDEDEQRSLTDSIREAGRVKESLEVHDAGIHQKKWIVAGERRWRAAMEIDPLMLLPCLVRVYHVNDAFVSALVENYQRANLNAIEEADAFQKAIEELRISQAELAQKLGAHDQSFISNRVRLLKLPIEFQQLISDGLLLPTLARDHLITWTNESAGMQQRFFDIVYQQIGARPDPDERIATKWLESVTAQLATVLGKKTSTRTKSDSPPPKPAGTRSTASAPRATPEAGPSVHVPLTSAEGHATFAPGTTPTPEDIEAVNALAAAAVKRADQLRPAEAPTALPDPERLLDAASDEMRRSYEPAAEESAEPAKPSFYDEEKEEFVEGDYEIVDGPEPVGDRPAVPREQMYIEPLKRGLFETLEQILGNAIAVITVSQPLQPGPICLVLVPRKLASSTAIAPFTFAGTVEDLERDMPDALNTYIEGLPAELKAAAAPLEEQTSLV